MRSSLTMVALMLPIAIMAKKGSMLVCALKTIATMSFVKVLKVFGYYKVIILYNFTLSI